MKFDVKWPVKKKKKETQQLHPVLRVVDVLVWKKDYLTDKMNIQNSPKISIRPNKGKQFCLLTKKFSTMTQQQRDLNDHFSALLLTWLYFPCKLVFQAPQSSFVPLIFVLAWKENKILLRKKIYHWYMLDQEILVSFTNNYWGPIFNYYTKVIWFVHCKSIAIVRFLEEVSKIIKCYSFVLSDTL